MAIFVIERIDEHKGTYSIVPLLLVGLVSILYWRQVLNFLVVTVQKQQSLDWLLTCEAVICRFFDDLRPYALVQFVPCIVIPLMAILLPPMYTHSTYWLWAAG